MTPPALARMSGMTSTPRSSRILSAPGVVGWLAASTTTRARTASALSSVITSPSAAGISTSQSQLEQLLVGDASSTPSSSVTDRSAVGELDQRRRRRARRPS